MARTPALLVALSLLALSAHATRGEESRPVVRDMSGAVIGMVLGPASADDASDPIDEPLLWIAHPVPGADVRLLIGESGPWDTKGLEPLLYESDDCTGAPF